MAQTMTPATLSVILSLCIVAPLIAFWIWMFRDMIRNDELTNTAKDYWALAFLFLNVFAAGLYYLNVYRKPY